MVLQKDLKIPTNIDRNNYSQNFAVNTIMTGQKVAVGNTLGLLIIMDAGGYPSKPFIGEPYFGPLIPGQEQRLKIRVPNRKSPIEVDVILAGTSEISVDAVLEQHKYKYDRIEVYKLDEVEIEQ